MVVRFRVVRFLGLSSVASTPEPFAFSGSSDALVLRAVVVRLALGFSVADVEVLFRVVLLVRLGLSFDASSSSVDFLERVFGLVVLGWVTAGSASFGLSTAFTGVASGASFGTMRSLDGSSLGKSFLGGGVGVGLGVIFSASATAAGCSALGWVAGFADGFSRRGCC